MRKKILLSLLLAGLGAWGQNPKWAYAYTQGFNKCFGSEIYTNVVDISRLPFDFNKTKVRNGIIEMHEYLTRFFNDAFEEKYPGCVGDIIVVVEHCSAILNAEDHSRRNIVPGMPCWLTREEAATARAKKIASETGRVLYVQINLDGGSAASGYSGNPGSPAAIGAPSGVYSSGSAGRASGSAMPVDPAGINRGATGQPAVSGHTGTAAGSASGPAIAAGPAVAARRTAASLAGSWNFTLSWPEALHLTPVSGILIFSAHGEELQGTMRSSPGQRLNIDASFTGGAITGSILRFTLQTPVPEIRQVYELIVAGNQRMEGTAKNMLSRRLDRPSAWDVPANVVLVR